MNSEESLKCRDPVSDICDLLSQNCIFIDAIEIYNSDHTYPISFPDRFFEPALPGYLYRAS